jgi:hypothetical protein
MTRLRRRALACARPRAAGAGRFGVRARRLAVSALGAALLVLASGCATFAELPPRTHLRPSLPSPYPHGSLRVDLADRSYPARPERRFDWLPRPTHAEPVLAALAESGWFAPVGTEVEAPDFLLTVDVRRRESFPYGVLLSALTAFLVPTSTHNHLSVTMSLTLEGDRAWCAVHSGFRTWYQLFLLPFSLTHEPSAHERELARRLTLACLDDLLDSLGEREEQPPESALGS